MPEPAFDPETLLAALHREGVRFVLIGGMAAVLHGDVGVTVDVDIAPAADAGNLERLAAALRSLDARVRTEGTPDGLAFDCSPAFFEHLGPGAILNLTTRAGALDIAFVPAGTAGYRDLKRDAVSLETSPGVFVLVASLADVIRSKSAADREKDRQALPRLYDLLAKVAARREAGNRGSEARRSEKMLGAFDSGIPELAEDHDRYLAEDFDD